MNGMPVKYVAVKAQPCKIAHKTENTHNAI